MIGLQLSSCDEAILLIHDPCSARPASRAAAALLFVILLSFSQIAAAQAPPPETEGSAEFAFIGTAGNSSTQTLGLAGELVYRPDVWETRLKLSFVRNQAEDELRAQSFFLSLRGQRPIRPRLSGYAQYGYQRDRFAGILDRNTIEGGLAYSVLDEALQKLTADAGIGYANEQRLVGNNLSTAILGTGVLYTLKISESSDISEEGRLVFSLSEASDWRYGNIVALSARVTTIFSLKLSNTIRYVNAPVFGFKNTDAVTAIAVVAKF
jgi:putative salt-induced outer membrane protein YdiY